MFGEHAAVVPVVRQPAQSDKSRIKIRNRFSEAEPLVVSKPGQERKNAPEPGQMTQRVVSNLSQAGDRGIIPRALSHIFESVESPAQTTLTVSFI